MSEDDLHFTRAWDKHFGEKDDCDDSEEEDDDDDDDDDDDCEDDYADTQNEAVKDLIEAHCGTLNQFNTPIGPVEDVSLPSIVKDRKLYITTSHV